MCKSLDSDIISASFSGEKIMTEIQQITNVTRDVLEKFITRLKENGVDADVAERLSTVLFGESKAAEKELRQALFPSPSSDRL